MHSTGRDAAQAPDSMSEKAWGTRRYGFACASCKSRKVKCSGDQPVCAGCQRSGDKCIWPTSASQKSQQSRRLQEANERIRELEASLRDQEREPGEQPEHSQQTVIGDADEPAVSNNGLNSQNSQHTELDRRLRSPSAAPGPARHTTNAVRRGSVALSERCDPGTVRSSGGSSQASSAARNLDPSLATNLWYQVGIGEDGTVIYNGPTSRFHAGSLPNGGDVSDGHDGHRQNGATSYEALSDGAGSDETTPGRRKRRRTVTSDADAAHSAALQSQYALLDAVWIPLIEAKPAMNGTRVDTITGLSLLDIYWSWLHPLHSIVYRPTFMMDLALGGPNCSDFLLLCIFALAARHLPSEGHDSQHTISTGEQYVAQAKELLLEEMTAPTPQIPTIQGLLILGGRQCAMGMSSQGWLFTGMAIRMMQDIGLHLDNTKLVGYMGRWTPAELETRKRLYNSAYIWDKTLSLALGRPPSLIRPPYPESEILDKFDDQRQFRPVHAKEVAGSFTPSPSWAATTFCAFCSLHEITTDMMLLLSSNAVVRSIADQIQELDDRFCTWYSEMPSNLKIESPASLDHSPPPHIVSLNLLYHTLHILLRRPLLSGDSQGIYAEQFAHCVTHSKRIYAIHSLYARTFPHRLMTYQVSYCIYTAATVEALELKRPSASAVERKEAASRLAAAVQILQNEANHTPGSGRSVNTIRRLLSEGERQTFRDQRKKSLPGHWGTRFGPRSSPNGGEGRRTPVQDTHVSTSTRNSGGKGRFPRPTVASGDNEGFVEDGVVMQNRQHQDDGHIDAAPVSTSELMGEIRNFAASDGVPWAQGQHQDLDSIATSTAAEIGGFGGFWDDPSYVGSTNTGAGFHPDSFSWGLSDDFTRRLPSGPHHSQVANILAPAGPPGASHNWHVAGH